MANPASKTYRPIPPPPLPEFYLRKTASKSSSATASQADGEGVRLPSQPRQRQLPPIRHLPPAPPFGDGASDGPVYKTYTYTTASKLPPVPTASPKESLDSVPPLAVYHICRLCLRPRSARYHREHPIPVDGLPPPPGICRRCRISSVNGSKLDTEVVELHESGEVKLGLKCLLPDDDYIPARALARGAETARAEATERFIRETEYMELESASEREGDIVYRRVKASAPQQRATEFVYRPAQTVPPPPPVANTKSKKKETVTIASNAVTIGQNSPFRLESPVAMRPMPVRTVSPTAFTRADSVRDVRKTRTSSRSRHSHRTSIVIEAQKPERTEAEIRRLARDEVVRYRQAERMMEAHGDVYAHSRIVAVEESSKESAPVTRVPVERRIALEKDVVERPWEKSPEPQREPEIVYAPARKAAVGDKIAKSVRKEDTVDILKQGTGVSNQVDLKKNKEMRVELRRYSMPSAKRGAQPTESTRQTQETQPLHGFHRADSSTTSSSRWTDREYWLDGQPAQTALAQSSKAAEPRGDKATSTSQTQRLHLERQPIIIDTVPRRPGTEKPSHRRSDDIAQSAKTSIPPYPAEESIVSAQMPSPKSHTPKSKTCQPQDAESEYLYVERTVEAADRSTKGGYDKPYYQVREKYGRRRKPPQARIEPGEESAQEDMRQRDNKLHTSDVSSRVHFAKNVEFSPTPPASDASSSNFRALGRMRAQETGEGLLAEYERRGRLRSRLPYDGYDYRWQRKPATAQQPGPIPAKEADRDHTVRPVERVIRRHGSSEMSTLLSNIRPLARAKSESPSREKLYQTARRQKEDGFGPYRTEEKRGDSLEVEDGSRRISDRTSSSGSSSSSGYRFVRRETIQRGPR